MRDTHLNSLKIGNLDIQRDNPQSPSAEEQPQSVDHTTRPPENKGTQPSARLQQLRREGGVIIDTQRNNPCSPAVSMQPRYTDHMANPKNDPEQGNSNFTGKQVERQQESSTESNQNKNRYNVIFGITDYNRIISSNNLHKRRNELRKTQGVIDRIKYNIKRMGVRYSKLGIDEGDLEYLRRKYNEVNDISYKIHLCESTIIDNERNNMIFKYILGKGDICDPYEERYIDPHKQKIKQLKSEYEEKKAKLEKEADDLDML